MPTPNPSPVPSPEELHRRMHSDAERFWCGVHSRGWPTRDELDAHVREEHGRLPYHPPTLTHVGSVRKLTLSGTGHAPDFSAGRHRHPG
jgi:hypothetical protein